MFFKPYKWTNSLDNDDKVSLYTVYGSLINGEEITAEVIGTRNYRVEFRPYDWLYIVNFDKISIQSIKDVTRNQLTDIVKDTISPSNSIVYLSICNGFFDVIVLSNNTEQTYNSISLDDLEIIISKFNSFTSIMYFGYIIGDILNNIDIPKTFIIIDVSVYIKKYVLGLNYEDIDILYSTVVKGGILTSNQNKSNMLLQIDNELLILENIKNISNNTGIPIIDDLMYNMEPIDIADIMLYNATGKYYDFYEIKIFYDKEDDTLDGATRYDYSPLITEVLINNNEDIAPKTLNLPSTITIHIIYSSYSSDNTRLTFEIAYSEVIANSSPIMFNDEGLYVNTNESDSLGTGSYYNDFLIERAEF